MKMLMALIIWLGGALILVMQPLPSARYSLGPDHRGPLPYGFWSPETSATASYRWSDGSSWLRFFGYATAESLGVSLQLIGPQGSRGEATLLQVQTPNEILLTTTAPAAWRTYHLVVPVTGPGWRTPELELAGTVAAGVPGDQRLVGVAVSQVTVRPLGGLHYGAVLEYVLFIGLALWLSWFISYLVVGLRWAWLLPLSILVALFGWQYAAPDLMAYWVPPLWAMLLLPLGGGATLWACQRLIPLCSAQPLNYGGIGLGLSLVAGLALRYQIWPILSSLMLVSGALLATAAVTPFRPTLTVDHPPPPWQRWYPLMLFGMVALALSVRLIDLNHLPLGMWRDEARHGLLALRILNDETYRPVYDANADLPALIFYLQSLSISLFGPTVLAVRIVPAFAGALTVALVAGMASQWWGRMAGLVAAGLLATSFWHLWLSRMAFAAVLDPLFTVLALLLLWRICANRGSQRQQLGAGLMAGLALGLALYTYHPARLMPLAALLWIGLQLGLKRSVWQRVWRPLVVFGVSFVLVASPLLWYFVSQTAAFNQRVGQVSLLDRQDRAWSLTTDLDYNLARYTQMWHVMGDQAARHNLPGQPMLDPLTGSLFLIGLLLLLLQRPAMLWLPLLALFGVALLPGLLSNDAPHAVRTVDAIVPAVLIATYGASAIMRMFAQVAPRLFRSGILLGMAGLLSINAGTYLGRVPYDQRVWDAFHYQAETAIAQTIQAGLCPGQAFVPAQYADSEVMEYLTFGYKVETYQIADLNEPFPPGACIFVASDTSALQWRHVEQFITGSVAPTVVTRYPGTDQPIVWWYRIPKQALAAPPNYR